MWLLRFSTTVRLLNDGNTNEGRFEVFLDFSWKPVCTTSWSLHSAHIVCRELGFKNAIATKRQNLPANFYQSKYHYELICGATGNETTVMDCDYAKSYYAVCSEYENDVAAVICNDGNSGWGGVGYSDLVWTGCAL